MSCRLYSTSSDTDYFFSSVLSRQSRYWMRIKVAILKFKPPTLLIDKTTHHDLLAEYILSL
jgi:hypothetical protein